MPYNINSLKYVYYRLFRHNDVRQATQVDLVKLIELQTEQEKKYKYGVSDIVVAQKSHCSQAAHHGHARRVSFTRGRKVHHCSKIYAN